MTVSTGARFRTRAKVNLFLRVLGLRPDGYHEVETILQTVDLYDDLEVETRASGLEIDMSFAPGRGGALPSFEDNLINEAARKLSTRLDRPPGAHIRVTKRIPIGGGLGGGSGNAAAALVALSELWGVELDRAQLLDLAQGLGSDVPYCLEGGTALATERGENLTQLPSPEVEMWFMVAGMHEPLSTRDVYTAWDSIDATPLDGPHTAPLMLALGAGDLAEVGPLLHNDLEPAAFRLWPELETKKEKVAASGVLGAAMSGSGPTMYGLVDTQDRARAAAARLEDDFDWIEVVASHPECVERVR